MDNVQNHLAPNQVSQSKELTIFKPVYHLFNLHVMFNQYLLVVMLLIGLLTLVVFSLIVHHQLITVFYLLDIPLNIGSLKTLGEQVGENLVTSDLLEVKILAVLLTLLVFLRDHQ